MSPFEFDKKLARQLAQDELFDLTLYRSLRRGAGKSEAAILDELIPIEVRHLAYWQQYVGESVETLTFGQRCKLQIMLIAAKVFGDKFVHLLLESIEIYGIRKYLAVWDAYENTPLGAALHEIIDDELGHEDAIISRFHEKRLSSEKIRTIFLGVNDGLVEILGAVSGFFAAFDSANHVLIAAMTVAVAGAFSMAAGVFVSSGSEKEVMLTAQRRRQFLNHERYMDDNGDHPFRLAVIVGVAYLAASLVPILPVLFGAKNFLAPLLMSGTMIVLISLVLAFISGMNIKRRILTNVIITALAVLVTYSIGVTARAVWGIPI